MVAAQSRGEPLWTSLKVKSPKICNVINTTPFPPLITSAFGGMMYWSSIEQTTTGQIKQDAGNSLNGFCRVIDAPIRLIKVIQSLSNAHNQIR
jgi:hypothetical protein